MYQPTVYFTCVGLVMLKPGWMYRYTPSPPAAQTLPDAAVRARRRYIVLAGMVYCAASLSMAVANALLAGYGTQKAWALFNAAGSANRQGDAQIAVIDEVK
jgi:hypothetical protein